MPSMYADINHLDPAQDEDLDIPAGDLSDLTFNSFDPEATAEAEFTPRPLMCMFWPGL